MKSKYRPECITQASQLGFMYYCPLGVQIVHLKTQNMRYKGMSYSNNNLAESNKKAVPDSTFFDQLVIDAVLQLKRGKECYCFELDHIAAIRKALPITYEIEVLQQDGMYRLYAHRGN